MTRTRNLRELSDRGQLEIAGETLSGFVLCCATHWQDQDMVVLTTPGDAGGKPVTILAADLIKEAMRRMRESAGRKGTA